jgi:hypothetical protein
MGVTTDTYIGPALVTAVCPSHMVMISACGTRTPYVLCEKLLRVAHVHC